MNKQQAEAKVQLLVKDIDAVRRAPGLTPEERTAAVAQIEADLAELRKITGPAHITGIYGG